MVSNAANVARSRVQPYSWKVQNSAGPPWSNQAQRLAIRAPARSRRSVRAVAGQEHRAARDRTDDDDEDPLPAASLLFRVRRWCRLALPGQAGDPLLLVSYLARPTRGTRTRQQIDRC